MQESSRPKSQLDKFREAARVAETDDREEAFDAMVRRIATLTGRKVCPECGKEFQGNGWDGIDAHWKSKHDHIMPYAEAWPLIKADRYSRK